MYCSIEQFILRIQADEAVMQSNWEPSELFANRPFIEAHLAAASARIDAEISKRYAVPVMPVLGIYPPLLTQIALYWAWWAAEILGEIRQTVERHYEQALKDLELLGNGGLNLIGADGKLIQPFEPGGEPGSASDVVHTLVAQRPSSLEFWTRPIRPIDGERYLWR